LIVGISVFFYDEGEDGQPCTVEYFGQVENIVELHFTSFEVKLIKRKWYVSKSLFKTRPNLLLDECGFLRVKTSPLPSHLPTHEPFVRPEDCDCVFFINDRLNKGWNIIVKYEPRAVPVVYKGIPAPCGSGSTEVSGSIPPNSGPQPSLNNSTTFIVESSKGGHAHPREGHGLKPHSSEPFEDDNELAANFQSEESNSSDGRSDDETQYSDREEFAFVVDEKGTWDEPFLSPQLRKKNRYHIHQGFLGELHLSDSNSDGNEDYDDNIGELSSP
jgi:hypothetical protein